MTADSIIQLITVLLGSGGLITIFLVSEKKTAAMLENMAKANEEWKNNYRSADRGKQDAPQRVHKPPREIPQTV